MSSLHNASSKMQILSIKYKNNSLFISGIWLWESGFSFFEPIILAGIPTAVELAGTSFTTTEFAPIFEFSPIVMFPSIFAPAPTTTPFSSVGWRFSFSKLTPPKVTPWYSKTSFPIIAVSPITVPVAWSIKTLLPIVAPGWISTPVKNFEIPDIALAILLKFFLYYFLSYFL